MPWCGPIYGTTPFGAFATSDLISTLGIAAGIVTQDAIDPGGDRIVVRFVVFVLVSFLTSIALHVLFFFGLGFGGGMLASSERPTRTEQRDTTCATLFAGQPKVKHVSEVPLMTDS